MEDRELLHTLVGLCDAIRDVPDSPEQRAIAARFVAVVQQLTRLQLIPRDGMWQLSSRR
jgi:hypothetical protein